MRLSREDKNAKIVELYKSGWGFRQLQKRYHVSPNYIASLVRGIEVTCTICGKPKGKVRFHAHHPDRLNRPDYTIPLCPSCHAKEEANFEEKAELIARLGVKVIPAEDLKTRRICCRLNMNNAQKKGGENGLTKVTFGGAEGTEQRTFQLKFSLIL